MVKRANYDEAKSQIASARVALAEAHRAMRSDSDEDRERPIWDGIHELRDVIAGVYLATKGVIDAVESLVEERQATPILDLDSLAKLASLKDSGALTDEEFAVQKARFLGESN